MDFWGLVLGFGGPVLACFGFFAVRGWLRGRRADRRLETMAAEGRATVRCRVRGDAPYPPVWTPGVLELADGAAALRPEEGPAAAIRLPAGAVEVVNVRSASAGDGIRTDRDDFDVVMTTDGSGTALQLLVPVEEGEALVELLQLSGPLTGPEVPVAEVRQQDRRLTAPGWALACLAAASLGALACGALWWGSEPVRVTITGPVTSYDLCPVEWTDPWAGTPQDAQISCFDGDQPGDDVEALALPTPFRGEVFDTESFPMLLVLVCAPVAGLGLAGIAWASWRRRGSDWAERPLGTGAPADVPLPRLGGSDLDATSVALAVRARAAREGWHLDGSPRAAVTAEQAQSTPWWRLPALRGTVLGAAACAMTAVVPLGLGVLGGWTAWGSWAGLRDTPVAVATAEVGEVSETFPLLPVDLEVRFIADTGEQLAWVALVGDPPEGPVRVLYSLDDPQRARMLGEGDGTRRGMLLSGLLVGGALVWGGGCVHRSWRVRRELLTALHDGPRAVRPYALTRGPEGEPLLLLFADAAAAPRWVVPLAEDVHSVVPLHGEVEVRGRLAAGEALIPVLPERVLWPADPLLEIEPDDALALVTGSWREELDDDVPA